ncbi:cyclophilin-like fold protein [uncultured Draconibacterium sp.]|uniref:cyclophilin-like fold protein n=1 Tax=uncultured Draconibacterium sp. TaxID=1573823 RepID=UPI002AA9584F|nr:cyclophilin-like fold protein [uncultured Draconibacterium sp.]
MRTGFKRIPTLFVFALFVFSTSAVASKNLTEKSAIEESTPVILEMNGTEIKATLNNTLTAREFIKLLPYSVTVTRAADDLCGSVSEKLETDRSEGKKSGR